MPRSKQMSLMQTIAAEKSTKQAADDFAYTMFAATRSRQRALVRFIRMADYILAAALQTLLLDTCDSFIQQLKPRPVQSAVDHVRCCYLTGVPGCLEQLQTSIHCSAPLPATDPRDICILERPQRTASQLSHMCVAVTDRRWVSIQLFHAMKGCLWIYAGCCKHVRQCQSLFMSNVPSVCCIGGGQCLTSDVPRTWKVCRWRW
jgi:hypothetical protein